MPVTADHLQIELVSENEALVPGQMAWLGLHLRHEPHWHTYWINPGDSGLPTRVRWTLPEGFTAEAIEWPAPSRFEIGGLYTFGYAGEQLLPVAIHVPADARPGAIASLAVDATWLICREECITGKARLDLDLPIVKADARVPTSAAACSRGPALQCRNVLPGKARQEPAVRGSKSVSTATGCRASTASTSSSSSVASSTTRRPS